MPRRTIGLEQIQVRPGRNRKARVHADLSSLEGFDLLELFYGFFANLPRNYLVDQRRGRYTRIDEVVPLGRTVMVVAESGHFGETGQTIDTTTHETEHVRTPSQSATTRTRLTLALPRKVDTGLFLVEREGVIGAGHDLISHFRDALVARWAQHSFDTSNVLYPEAWATGAELLEVEAVVWTYAPDIADGITPKDSPIGTLRQSIVPTRLMQGVLPGKLYTALRNHDISTSELLSLPNAVIDETFLTVKKDGRRKRFALDHDRSPSIRIEVTADGEPALTDSPYIRRCQDEAQEFYEAVGLRWQDQWRDGQWTDEQKSRQLHPHQPTQSAGA